MGQEWGTGPPALFGEGRWAGGRQEAVAAEAEAAQHERQLLHHQHNSWSFPVSQRGWGRGGGLTSAPRDSRAPSSPGTGAELG